MADITLNITDPDPTTLTGHANATTITIENSVGEEVTMSWDSGLFIPNRGTQPATSIAIGATETYKLGAATAAAGKGYSYSWGNKRGLKSGTIVVS